MNSQWDEDGLSLTIYSEDRVGPVRYKFSGILEERKSPFQIIRVMDHEAHGKTLIVGDDVMSANSDTEYDRAMLDLLPDMDHMRVLIMGGGDGSLAAELCDLPNVARVTCCEIDSEVLDVCRRHFPISLNGEAHKLHVNVGDAFRYLYENADKYDVVFDDMTVEPTHASEDYRLNLARAFRGKWVISQTGEHKSKSETRIIRLLQDEATAEFHRFCRYCPLFETFWTFTKYRLA